MDARDKLQVTEEQAQEMAVKTVAVLCEIIMEAQAREIPNDATLGAIVTVLHMYTEHLFGEKGERNVH